jgi:hypothetical protein
MKIQTTPLKSKGPDISPLSQDREYAEAFALLADLHRRAAECETLIARLRAQLDGWADPTEQKLTPLGQARALMEGKLVVRSFDRRFVEAKLTEATAEADLLAAAICEQTEIVAAITSKASFAACSALRDRHRALLVEILRAARLFSEAVQAERNMRAAIIAASYSYRADVLPSPLLPAGLQLGSEVDWNSQIAVFRRALEKEGII